MDITHIIQTWGYWAVAGGTLAEGETVLLAAAALAARGLLALPAVLAIATVCGFLGDQIFFLIGRRWGWRIVTRFPKFQPRAARVSALLERHHVPLILGVRFLYGLRVAGPIAIGMSGVHWSRFLALNFLGALAWAAVIGGLGYGLGQGASQLLPLVAGVDADEIALPAAAGALALGWGLVRHWRHAVRARAAAVASNAGAPS